MSTAIRSMAAGVLALATCVLAACSSSKSAPAGSGQCASLAECCTRVSASDQALCSAVVAGGAGTTCADELATFVARGECEAKNPATSNDSGTPGAGGQDAGIGQDAAKAPPPGGGTDSGTGGGADTGSGTGTCSSAEVVCPKGCADIVNDVNNCGSCGYACPPGPLGAPACVAGQCAFVCSNPAETYCAPIGQAAYCADTGTSTYDCGGCGNPCGGNSCQTPTCTNGQCGVAQLADGTQCPTGTSVGITAPYAFCAAGTCTGALALCYNTGGSFDYGDIFAANAGGNASCACDGTTLTIAWGQGITGPSSVSCSICQAFPGTGTSANPVNTAICLQ